MKVYTSQKIRKIEQLTEDYGIESYRLMENAGAVVAKEIRKRYDVSSKNIVVLCGNGNNGGDGFVTARNLLENGANVTAVCVMGLSSTPNAAEAYNKYIGYKGNVINYSEDKDSCVSLLQKADLIIDAVFGIGLNRAPDNEISRLFEFVNLLTAPKIAVDIPSGICADTGEKPGSCIKADLTVTFIGLKLCNLLFPGIDFCGEVVLHKIGVPGEIFETFRPLAETTVQPIIQKRERNTHKGSYGNALIIAGSYGMAGAVILAARAALKSGIGVLRVALPESIYGIVASAVPEAVFLPVKETERGYLSCDGLKKYKKQIEKADCVLFGPGVGNWNECTKVLAYIYNTVTTKLILDADGINALSQSINFTDNGAVKLIITPHPGEMSRLLNTNISEIEKDRLKYALCASQKYRCITVLKGAVSIIASYDGAVRYNLTGNPGMATGGSGDVLSGISASFCANEESIFDAMCNAVYVHGCAGDKAAQKLSQTAMLPSDLINELPEIYKEFGE